MRHALRAPGSAPPFHSATHTPVNILADRLREIGLVTLEGLGTRAAVLGFAERIMEVTAHRDSEPDGLTTIYDTRRHAQQTGYAGLTASELSAHTERSGLPRPPRLMLLVCAMPASQGGECLLTDGRSVHAELTAHQPEALDLLSTPRTAYFGGGDGHATQVFTPHPGGRVALRLRTDGLARWNPLLAPYLPHLRAAIDRHQITLPLTVGQGYLLDNSRWLHARNAFTGDRLCWRALGEPRPSLFPLPIGFPTTASTPRPSSPAGRDHC
ncbi:TauD/TfdA family dioxygenase [Streptomyces sp. NPDC059991]|uniref:TauD/TfdA family dioxygenase n=1 Tax=Streptomyces sp. NPDC059991 TaxID=3347028 RepID=UPI0036C3F718